MEWGVIPILKVQRLTMYICEIIMMLERCPNLSTRMVKDLNEKKCFIICFDAVRLIVFRKKM